MDWDKYFIKMALEVAKASTCLRRNYGAVIVKDYSIVASGYNGAVRSEMGCIEKNSCARDILREKKGEVYNICNGIHAEMRVIMGIGRQGCKGATLYIASVVPTTGELFDVLPCELCARIIKESDLARVYGHNKKGEIICLS